MSTSDIAIIGLPGSGKTTLLAAIWAMIREAGSETALKFDRLSDGQYDHLNALATRWRKGKIQERTQTGNMKRVTMRLKDEHDRAVEVSFPDMPGEDVGRMWERREVEDSTRNALGAPAIVLTVNGDTIRFPAWIAEQKAIEKKAGLKSKKIDAVDWDPKMAPTQVKLVELLQFLMSGDLDYGPRRLALLITAWDKVQGENMSPANILAVNLPLLNQYLRNGRDPWVWRVWGVSAQGGVYEDQEKNEHFEATEKLRDIERPSDRIIVVGGDGKTVSTDITQPLEWLVE